MSSCTQACAPVRDELPRVTGMIWQDRKSQPKEKFRQVMELTSPEEAGRAILHRTEESLRRRGICEEAGACL